MHERSRSRLTEVVMIAIEMAQNNWTPQPAKPDDKVFGFVLRLRAMARADMRLIRLLDELPAPPSAQAGGAALESIPPWHQPEAGRG